MIHGQASSGPLGHPGLAPAWESAVDCISQYHDLDSLGGLVTSLIGGSILGLHTKKMSHRDIEWLT